MAKRSRANELVSKSIDKVLNGVSQQPPTIRFMDQCEAQDNMISKVSDGVSRRPPTEHVAPLDINPVPTEGYKAHVRARDEDTQHLVLIENGNIRVFNLFTGVEATVTDTSGTYLDITGDDANKAFAITSVADYSFVVNKETTVAMSTVTDAEATPPLVNGVTPARIHEFLIYFFEDGKASGSNWRHDIGAVDTEWNLTNTAPTRGAEPGDMILRLTDHVYNATNYPRWDFNIPNINVLHCWQDTDVGNPDSLTVPGYFYSDEVYSYIGPQTQRFSDLPAKGVDGLLTEITGADGNEENNYWVIFDEELSAWVETVGPEQQDIFDASTMPHVLIQTGASTFDFKPQDWDDRLKGDVDSAPEPSFVGRQITDVFFHKNRLGFLAGESAVLSESGEFFNFWPTTVTTIVDSDPIDAACTNNRIALLDHAVPFDQELYLFSGHGGVQNVLKQGGESMTNASAQIVEVSAYPTSTSVKPRATGQGLYFTVDRGVSSAVFHYVVQDEGRPEAFDITAHVPTYIPNNARDLTVSSKENILSMFCGTDSNTLYTYSFFFVNGERAQNCWSKWDFADDYSILAAEWVNEKLYLVIERTDGVYLEVINIATLTDGDLNFRVHLDSLYETTGVYTVADNLTTWTLPYDSDPETYGTFQAILTDTDHGVELGAVVPLTYLSSTEVTAEGDHSAGAAHIGRTYTHNYEFTKPVITAPDASGRDQVSVTQGRLQIKKFKILTKMSGGFEARVTSDEVNQNEVVTAEAEYVYIFPSKIVGAGTVGNFNPREVDEFLFDVGVESTYAKIRITGSSHLPFTLVGAEWEGYYSVRASRI
jgi:hypothetical protein